MDNREIKTLALLIVTNTALVEDTVVLKYVSLTSLTLPEAIEHGFSNLVGSIANRVETTIPVPYNLIAKWTVSKTQTWMSLQDFTARNRFERATHRIREMLAG